MTPYVNDMKGANLSGGGGPMTPVKHQQHQQPQTGGDRGGDQQKQAPFVLRGGV